MKKLIIVIGILFLGANVVYSQADRVWVNKAHGIRNMAIEDISIKNGKFYLATRNEVYESKDKPKQWRSIFSLPGSANRISCIGINSKMLFVGTQKGLYRSQDGGSNWKNVFRPVFQDKKDISCIEISHNNPEELLIGTGNGIFLSQDNGNKWNNLLKKKGVKCISANEKYLYAVCDDGLYSTSDKGVYWQRLLVTSKSGGGQDPEQEREVSVEEPEMNRGINCVTVKDDSVYVGTDKYLFHSKDNGKSWEAFPKEGIRGTINYILISQNNGKIFISTSKGVYEFSNEKERWTELYCGMPYARVKKISFGSDSEDILWSATNKGLFKLETRAVIERKEVEKQRYVKDLYTWLDDEPTFIDLQQAAIRYNEVSPEKIARWRYESKLKALLPRVSLGIDRSRSSNYESYKSSTKHYIIESPDDVKSDWDISLSWELSDLIWSTNQTSIDIRSKLMVQLRNDILDDLRRAYYERKRLLIEMAMDPPKNLRARMKKELRIQELTSAVDDLTGNYLTKWKQRSGD